MERLRAFCHGRAAQGLVEYALILALVVIVIVTALATIGGRTNQMTQNVANQWP